MKSFLLSFVLVAILPAISLSQTIWQVQESGTNTELTDVYFVDQNNGWISGWTETMLHTTDGGQTWTPQTIPPNNAYFSVFFTDSQNGWASATAGKIIHTTDGGETWTTQPSSTQSDLNSLYFINADTGWAAGGRIPAFPSNIPERTILGTTNGGNTWTIQYDQSNESVLKSIYFIDNNNGYATGGTGEVMHTTDGGNVWVNEVVANGNEFSDIFFANISTGWVVGDGGFPSQGVIYKTTDGGNNWNLTTLGTDIFLLGVYFTNQVNGWAVGNDFGNGNAGIVYHTTDAGNSWIVQNIPSVDALYSVYFPNSARGWAVGHLGTIIEAEGPTPVELTSFTAEQNNKDVVLSWRTATETNNKGFEIEKSQKSKVKSQMRWESIGFVEGHGTTTQENNYRYADYNLESGDYSYRLVQIDFDGTRSESGVVNVEVNTRPAEYSLRQNYPNPFNPSTIVEYSIPENGNVKVEIFNALGEEVTTLVNDYKQAGDYKVKFNASALSSGIYYYRIESGNFVKTRKMILLR